MEGPNQNPGGLSVVEAHTGKDDKNPFLSQHDEKLLLRERDLAKGEMGSNHNPNALDDVKAHARGDDEKMDQPSSNPPTQARGGMTKKSSEEMI
jgi:hypothetical protein